MTDPAAASSPATPSDFEGRLRAARRRFLWVVLTWIPLAWFDGPLRTEVAPFGIVSFELAATAERAASIMASWNAEARDAAWGSLVVDYAFMLAYGAWLAAWVRLSGETLGRMSALVGRVARGLAVGMWVAAGLDAVENAALFVVLDAGVDGTPIGPGWIAVASAAASLKFLLVVMGLFFGTSAAFARWTGAVREQ